MAARAGARVAGVDGAGVLVVARARVAARGAAVDLLEVTATLVAARALAGGGMAVVRRRAGEAAGFGRMAAHARLAAVGGAGVLVVAGIAGRAVDAARALVVLAPERGVAAVVGARPAVVAGQGAARADATRTGVPTVAEVAVVAGCAVGVPVLAAELGIA